MNIDERLEALAQTVELMASMQKTTEKEIQQTQKDLRSLTREMRLFRHFVLSLGANFESRLLNLEGPPKGTEPNDPDQ
jgi:hypothetical protein